MIYITGIGAFTCLGTSADDLWNKALKSESGIREGLGRIESVQGSNRALSFALSAIREAMTQAGWQKLNSDDGVILATTTGQIPMWDQQLIQFLHGECSKDDFQLAFAHQPLGSLLDNLNSELQHSGKSFLVSSACTSATQALALGALWLNEKRVKRCLIVGAEVLCGLTIEGFKSLHLLSNQTAKPFDKNRAGINLSEGAAAICLELESTRPLAVLSGFGLSTDAHHMTGPHPEGDLCLKAMSDALERAQLDPSQISWVHAHGTGSQQNDAAEGMAFKRLFGEKVPPVSSTKALHGHALGASGAIETVLCVKALEHQTVLKSAGVTEPDERIPVLPATENLKTNLKHILKTTLGFGGANAALIISALEHVL